jgi:hypothetical protein
MANPCHYCRQPLAKGVHGQTKYHPDCAKLARKARRAVEGIIHWQKMGPIIIASRPRICRQCGQSRPPERTLCDTCRAANIRQSKLRYAVLHAKRPPLTAKQRAAARAAKKRRYAKEKLNPQAMAKRRADALTKGRAKRRQREKQALASLLTTDE